MSQLPQNNEAFDYNPEYAKLYQEDNNEQPSPDTSDEQLLPANESPGEFSDQTAGKRAANFSLLFAFLSPLSFVLGFWLLVQGLGESGLQVALAAPVLNILGIWQGRVAQRHGTRALEGRILNGLGLCIFIGIAALFMYIANALSQIN
ncbi:MAG: hypothetical protein HXO69_02360 [Rothia sp.]|uniref:hypothetical protein n=1 Tax=Rothia sp. (in: high G+C Gram-positive bacteria) TaxID=1885016 RepID=UPI001CB57F8D|nr:hypothetical protein [Rothia sp. (in: high G+C Gram-positive bacteria)]MBF1680110.1 hypothetical protein [Rothia sp. (in: high G+C Gram-positive bacteria)]